MRRLLLVGSASLIFIAQAATAQTVSRAYCGKDGKVHVVYRNGTARTFAVEPQQVGCEQVTVAADGRTVGWSVLVENYATSYPIAVAVVVYRDGSKIVISDGLSIWGRHFIGAGGGIAVLSGPVHGGATVARSYLINLPVWFMRTENKAFGNRQTARNDL